MWEGYGTGKGIIEGTEIKIGLESIGGASEISFTVKIALAWDSGNDSYQWVGC